MPAGGGTRRTADKLPQGPGRPATDCRLQVVASQTETSVGDGRGTMHADGAHDRSALADADAHRPAHRGNDGLDFCVGVRLVGAVGEVAAEPVALDGGRVVTGRAQQRAGRGHGQAGEQQELRPAGGCVTARANTVGQQA